MTRWLALLIPCTLLTSISACAVQGRTFEQAAIPPGHSVVYVYRPYHYAGSALRPPVTCADETARIGPGGYHAFIVPASKTSCTVQSSETSDEVDIDATPRVHYIREEIGWGVLTGHPRLDPVDDDRANTDIQTCCVLEGADVDTVTQPKP